MLYPGGIHDDSDFRNRKPHGKCIVAQEMVCTSAARSRTVTDDEARPSFA